MSKMKSILSVLVLAASSSALAYCTISYINTVNTHNVVMKSVLDSPIHDNSKALLNLARIRRKV